MHTRTPREICREIERSAKLWGFFVATVGGIKQAVTFYTRENISYNVFSRCSEILGPKSRLMLGKKNLCFCASGSPGLTSANSGFLNRYYLLWRCPRASRSHCAGNAQVNRGADARLDAWQYVEAHNDGRVDQNSNQPDRHIHTEECSRAHACNPPGQRESV